MNELYRAYKLNNALFINNNTKNKSLHYVNVSESSHHTNVFFNNSAQSTQYSDLLYSCHSCKMPLETSKNL